MTFSTLAVMAGGAVLTQLIDQMCGVRVEGPSWGRIVHIAAILSWGVLLWVTR